MGKSKVFLAWQAERENLGLDNSYGTWAAETKCGGKLSLYKKHLRRLEYRAAKAIAQTDQTEDEILKAVARRAVLAEELIMEQDKNFFAWQAERDKLGLNKSYETWAEETKCGGKLWLFQKYLKHLVELFEISEPIAPMDKTKTDEIPEAIAQQPVLVEKRKMLDHVLGRRQGRYTPY